MNYLVKAVYSALQIYVTPLHVVEYVQQSSTQVEK